MVAVRDSSFPFAKGRLPFRDGEGTGRGEVGRKGLVWDTRGSILDEVFNTYPCQGD